MTVRAGVAGGKRPLRVYIARALAAQHVVSAIQLMNQMQWERMKWLPEMSVY